MTSHPGQAKTVVLEPLESVNETAGVAAVPLAIETGGRLRIIVTTPGEARRTGAAR